MVPIFLLLILLDSRSHQQADLAATGRFSGTTKEGHEQKETIVFLLSRASSTERADQYTGTRRAVL